MTRWDVTSAAVLGRDHAVVRRNRQDAAASGGQGDACWGVVADGCGQGACSEVGAQLSVVLAGHALRAGLEQGEPLERVATSAVAAVVAGLSAVAALVEPSRRTSFVAEHLLATLLGFVARGDLVVAFGAGDGVLWLGERGHVLDQGNAPRYPAFELLGRNFDLRIEHAHASSVAVATDGLTLDQVATLLGEPTPRVGRRLHVLARAELQGDDAAVALAHREAGAPCEC